MKKKHVMFYFTLPVNMKAITRNYNALRSKEPVDDALFNKYKEDWEKVDTITIIDEDYPALFKTVNIRQLFYF